MDPLAKLGRKDKWFLGGGKGAIYAPPFPKHLLAPGFWDDCYLADIKIPRLFTVLFLEENGSPIRFESYLKGWRPDRLTIMHYSGDVVVRERRCVTAENAWVSEFELVTAVRPLHVFVWSLPEVRPPGYGTPWQSLVAIEPTEDSMRVQLETAWPSELEPDRTGIESESIAGGEATGPPLPVYLEYGASHPRQSFTVNMAQRHDDSPLYELSVLPEKFVGGLLSGDFKPFAGPEPVEGLAHIVQHYVLEDRRPIVLACGAGLTPKAARASLEEGRQEDVLERSAESWRAYFRGVPQFSSSDEYLTNAYWHRWYGLRLNTVDMAPPIHGKAERFSAFVTEGIGFFRNFVSYSAQAHLREVSWMHDPALAKGILENFGKVQREDGSFPGHNYSCRPARDFYHSDIGTGMVQFRQLHPGAVDSAHGETLRRYADYLIQNRTQSKDPFGPTLYDIFDQNETGQEYMSRYQFASDAADKWGSFRVGGVDATCYAVAVFQSLGFLSIYDKEAKSYAIYGKYAHGARMGLAELSFDEEQSFFCDVLPDGQRSPARPATGLYPLAHFYKLWHSVPIEQVIDRWLINGEEFNLAKGFPATAASDPTFSAEGEWKEKRLNCPWSGRSWPMANSHLVEGLVEAAQTVLPLDSEDLSDDRLRRLAADALTKSIRLMFHNGDPQRPNSYEHYDPVTGVPSLYRGYDDYMHSWIVDLILRYAVGVQPGSDEIDPLPLGVDWIECRDIPHAEGRMHVRIDHGVARVEIERYAT